MGELPSGTVSMLFSDIEGSTLLLSRLGPSYPAALDDHRRIMRAAWAAHGGTEMGTEGDSFFVVFPTAASAVRGGRPGTARAARARVARRGALRVRIGIHTGSPRVHDGDYVGMDVHRAARIAGSAHGGQVVVSAVDGGPRPRGAARRGRPARPRPPPPQGHPRAVSTSTSWRWTACRRTSRRCGHSATSSSLPDPARPWSGERATSRSSTSLLGSPEARLVTLTGPGGSGKTRLAIAVAEQPGAAVRRRGATSSRWRRSTTADVMWTSIAETLDVPPRARAGPAVSRPWHRARP